MLKIRKSEERGCYDHGWLKTYHTFSFADYHDPQYSGFRNLRVINEDIVQPDKGFATHPHHDMEIITYVIQGALVHRDNMENQSIIKTDDVQYMCAGTGVKHSEYNPSKNEPVHLIQIWILPNKHNLLPHYDQKNFSVMDKYNNFLLLASPTGEQGSIQINQDIKLYACVVNEEREMTYHLKPQRYGWIQVVKGAILINDQTLKAGDGAASIAGELQFKGLQKNSEFLLFDLN